MSTISKNKRSSREVPLKKSEWTNKRILIVAAILIVGLTFVSQFADLTGQGIFDRFKLRSQQPTTVTIRDCPDQPYDLNYDFRVNQLDVQVITSQMNLARASRTKCTYRGVQYFLGDVNHNGEINEADIRLVSNAILTIPQTYPIPQTQPPSPVNPSTTINIPVSVSSSVLKEGWEFVSPAIGAQSHAYFKLGETQASGFYRPTGLDFGAVFLVAYDAGAGFADSRIDQITITSGSSNIVVKKINTPTGSITSDQCEQATQLGTDRASAISPNDIICIRFQGVNQQTLSYEQTPSYFALDNFNIQRDDLGRIITTPNGNFVPFRLTLLG